MRDRAESQRALEALRASEERFRLLVDGVYGYAIFTLDARGRRISSWNEGARRAKGYTAGEIVGQHYEVLFTTEDRAAGLPRELLAQATRDGHLEVEGVASSARTAPAFPFAAR